MYFRIDNESQKTTVYVNFDHVRDIKCWGEGADSQTVFTMVDGTKHELQGAYADKVYHVLLNKLEALESTSMDDDGSEVDFDDEDDDY